VVKTAALLRPGDVAMTWDGRAASVAWPVGTAMGGVSRNEPGGVGGARCGFRGMWIGMAALALVALVADTPLPRAAVGAAVAIVVMGAEGVPSCGTTGVTGAEKVRTGAGIRRGLGATSVAANATASIPFRTVAQRLRK
jgi:hypothetical protein